MNLPKEIKVMGHKYIVEKHPLVLQKVTPGDACVNTKLIRLDPSVGESSMGEAFLHEIIEVLKYHLSLPLKHEVLASLSEGLYQVIHDNKLKF